MKDKNIRFDPSRYGAYKKVLGDLEYHRINNSLDKYLETQNSKEILYAFFEADELLFVFEQFRHDCPDFFIRKFGQVMQGPIGMDEENTDDTSNHPRNLLFELKMQAVIRASVLKEGSSDDASCIIDGSSLILECKRPQYSTSIKRNFSKARNQLRTTLGDLSNIKSRGVIALSLGKTFHEGSKYLEISHSDLLGAKLAQRIDKVVKGFRLLEKIASDKKIPGLLCELSTPVVIDDQKLVIAATQFKFFSRGALSDNELTTINKFVNAIKDYFHPHREN